MDSLESETREVGRWFFGDCGQQNNHWGKKRFMLPRETKTSPKHCWGEHEGFSPCSQTSSFLPLLWMISSGTLLNKYMCSLECPACCLFLLTIQSQLKCCLLHEGLLSFTSRPGQSLSWLPQHTELIPVYSTKPGLLWYFLLVFITCLLPKWHEIVRTVTPFLIPEITCGKGQALWLQIPTCRTHGQKVIHGK